MYKEKSIATIIVAGGTGSRMGSDVPKQYMKIGKETVLKKTVKTFDCCEGIDKIIVVADNVVRCKDTIKGIEACVVAGGKSRQESVYEGLKQADTDIVLVHDGVRPFVEKETIERIIATTAEEKAAVVAVKPKDTIREKERTLDRDKIFAVQTPQGFETKILKAAYEKAVEEGFFGTDDASLVERLGYKIAIVDGSYSNIKITTREDLPVETRVGTGYDAHRLVEGRKLIIGGVDIPYEWGLLGHSDADVLIHAVMDAILGGASMGDIGKLFPDTEEEYKGISSIKLLKKTWEHVKNEGWDIGNIDATLIVQKPKISPYINEMRKNIAEAVNIDIEKVSVKATTTEELGFTGRKEGMAAQAVCILNR